MNKTTYEIRAVHDGRILCISKVVGYKTAISEKYRMISCLGNEIIIEVESNGIITTND